MGTSPDLWSLDAAFERLLAPGGESDKRSNLPPGDTEWHALTLSGFGKLRLQQMFQRERHPISHLAWNVQVAQGALAHFPQGLVLQYGIPLEIADSTAHPTKTLRSLAAAYLRRDLCQAVAGALPAAARAPVFLDTR